MIVFGFLLEQRIRKKLYFIDSPPPYKYKQSHGTVTEQNEVLHI